MLCQTAAAGKAGRFAAPPWDDRHPDWLRLDARLAEDHLARQLDLVVDLLDLSGLQAAYRGTGTAAYRPELMLKVALYESRLGSPSPADWCRHARENEPARWLARGIEPSRARWYAFRDRLAPHLEGLNRQALQLAQALGLTEATRAAQDGTTVAARASRHRLCNAERLAGCLRLLQQACDADRRGAAPPPLPGWVAATARGRQQQLARYQRAEQALAARLRDEQHKRRCDRQDPAKLRVAPSEPEAALGLDKLKVYRPLYNVQLLADLDSPLVLAYGVFAQASDVGTLGPMLARAEGLLGHRLAQQAADPAYATGPHLAAAEQAGVEVYSPGPEAAAAARARRRPPAWLPKGAFRWDAAGGAYCCPRGHRLELATVRRQQRSAGERVRVEEYRCPAEHCRDCPLAAWCTPRPDRGRAVTRSEHEAAFERLRQRMASAEGQQAYRLRKQTVELGFADQKEHRGLRRFCGRGPARAEAQVGLCVLAHNGLAVVRAAADTSRGKPPDAKPPEGTA